MSEMIERVASALCRVQQNPNPTYADLARAAIEAMTPAESINWQMAYQGALVEIKELERLIRGETDGPRWENCTFGEAVAPYRDPPLAEYVEGAGYEIGRDEPKRTAE